MSLTSKKFTFSELRQEIDVDHKDSVATLIATLKISGLFTRYPTWIETFVVPNGTPLCNRTGGECYGLLIAQYKAEIESAHPAGALETILVKKPATLTPVKVVVSDAESYDVRHSYLILEKDKAVQTVAAAYTADILTYYSRGDGAASLVSTIPPEKAKQIGVISADVVKARAKLEEFSSSVSVARDNIYNSVKDDSKLSLFLMSQLSSKFPAYRKKDDVLTKTVATSCKNADVFEVFLPSAGPISSIKNPTCDQAWRYLHDSRQTRGEDGAGIGVLTVGYYFFEMSRSMMINLAWAVDIINVCRKIKVDHVMVSDGIPDYSIRILLANSIHVFNDTNSSLPDYDPTKFEYCSEMPDEINFLHFKKNVLVPPVVRKRTIDYPKCSTRALLKSANKYEVVAFYVYLTPEIKQNNGVSLFPSIRCHNGSCIAMSSVYEGFGFDDLIKRMVVSNSYRNAFPYNRIPFCRVDPAQSFTKPLEPLKLPRMSTIKKIGETYVLEEIPDTVVEDVDMKISENAKKLFTVPDVARFKPAAPPISKAYARYMAYYKSQDDAVKQFRIMLRSNKLPDYIMDSIPSGVNFKDYMNSSLFKSVYNAACREESDDDDSKQDDGDDDRVDVNLFAETSLTVPQSVLVTEPPPDVPDLDDDNVNLTNALGNYDMELI